MTKHFPSALATAVVTTKMINTQQEGSPETPPLPVVLAASLGEGAVRRRHLSTPGDWPRENSPTGIG